MAVLNNTWSAVSGTEPVAGSNDPAPMTRDRAGRVAAYLMAAVADSRRRRLGAGTADAAAVTAAQRRRRA